MASQYDLVVIGGGTAGLGLCRRYEVVGRESRLARVARLVQRTHVQSRRQR